MKFAVRFAWTCGLLLLAALLLGITPPGRAAPASLYFGETGHRLDGSFLQYWQTHGDLAQFGYPLTPAFYEGAYLVQYFERNRFELHPENAGTPYEVLLGLLGSERLAASRLALPPETAQPGGQFFPATGYSVGGAFLQYWQTHGGLAQFGYPRSPQMPDEGRTVQYFERARLELHPENAGTPYYVLLTLLGYDRARKLDPVLLTPWAANPPPVQLNIEGIQSGGSVEALTRLRVTSDTAGELRVLGGDNRQYAAYAAYAGQPISLMVAGAVGRQSLVLMRDGQVAAARWAAFELRPPQTAIVTGDPVWDGLYARVKGFLEKDLAVYDSPLDGRPVRGYRSPDTPFIWLRDHVYQSKGFKFFEPDMKGTLDYFGQTQRPDGSFDDYFQYYRGYEVYKAQIEVEADREFLFVEGVWTAWQVTGDDEWLRAKLPLMERGLEHTFSDPKRWSAELGLVKRAFTIDTWDFEQGSSGDQIRRSLDDQTRWSIMHGDNTGAYAAARRLAEIERYFGRSAEAARWDERAVRLLQNLNKLAWNGSFYTHQVHLTPIDPTGVDEKTQLSLSNAYALNRGTLDQSQAAVLLRTYQARRVANANKIFAEWYSIDPPFPQGFGPPGEYVNGGVMPLVGGELARGAFAYGFETYGVDILRRYWELLDRTGGSYLWYHPDGKPGIGTDATLPTDGWGSAAMLNALIEGLAGVVDQSRLYQQVALSPRWAAAECNQGRVSLVYGTSGAYFAYDWQRHPDGSLSLGWGGGSTRSVSLSLLLPPQITNVRQVWLNNALVPFKVEKLENSLYLKVELPGSGQLVITS